MVKKIYFIFFCLLCIICSNLFSDNKFYSVGIDFYKAKNYTKAVQNLKKVEGKERDDPQFYYYLGNAFYYLKNYKEAPPHLTKYLLNADLKNTRIYGSYRESTSNLFQSYKQEKEWNKNIKISKQLLKRVENEKTFSRLIPFINNNIADSNSREGHQFFQIKDYTNAKKYYEESLLYNSSNIHTNERLGVSNFFLNLYQEAEKNFIFVLESSNIKIWRNISTSSYYLIQIKPDITPISETIKDKNILSYKILNIYDLLKKEKYTKAFEILEKLEEEEQTSGAIALDIVNKLQKDSSQPEQFFIHFIKFFPLARQADSLTNRALNTLRNNVNREKIRVDLVNTLKYIIEEKAPQDVKPKYENFLLKARFNYPTEENEEFLREKVESYLLVASKYKENPISKDLLFDVAMIYTKQLDNDIEAIKILEPLEEEAHRNSSIELANIYMKQEDFEKASLLFKKIASKNPKDEILQILLGESLLKAGNCDEGVDILQRVSTKTRNNRIKARITNFLSDYREIPLLENITINDTLFITTTELETYHSISINADNISLPLRQSVLDTEVYLFSQDKRSFPFSIEVESKKKPSLTEPYTLYEIREGKTYLAKWSDEKVASPNKWQHIKPFSIIYPSKEALPEGIKILRNNYFEKDELIVEIEIFFPSNNWDINIFNPSYLRRGTTVSPTPDSFSNSSVFYKNRGDNIKIQLIYPKRPDILNYYPEVVLTKKTISENRAIKNEKEVIQFNGVSVKTVEKIPNILFLKEVKTVVNLEEKVERL